MAAIREKIQGAGFLLGIPFLAGCMACLAYCLPGVSSILQYDRDRISSGEIWRLLTSHWAHWSAEHLLWDVVVFMILLALSFRINLKETGIVLGSASAVIPLGLYFLQPELICYRGLSGLDTALFAFVAVHLVKSLKQKGDRVGQVLVLMILAGLGLKIAFEAFVGEAFFVTRMAPNVIVVPLAHIIGAGIGLLLPILIHRVNTRFAPTTTMDLAVSATLRSLPLHQSTNLK